MYSGTGNTPSLAPPKHSKVVSDIVSSIKKWDEDNSSTCPPLMAFMLEVKEFENEASFESLDGLDYALARVLKQAQRRYSYDLFLADASIVMKYIAVDSDSSDEPQIKDDTCISQTATSTNLTSASGRRCIDSIHFNPKAFDLGKCDWLDWTPDHQNFSEDGETSNESEDDNDPRGSCFYQHSYHHTKYTCSNKYNNAVLLFWPLQNRTMNLGIVNAVSFFNKDLKDFFLGSRSSESISALENCAEKLTRLCCLPEHLEQMPAELVISFLNCLIVFGMEDLVLELFTSVASSNQFHSKYSSFGETVATIGNVCGWEKLNSPLQAIFEGEKESNALQKFAVHLISELEALSQRSFWPKNFELSCACASCRKLNSFLNNTTMQQEWFQVDQHERTHIMDKLRELNCLSMISTKYNIHYLVVTKIEAMVGLTEEEKSILSHLRAITEQSQLQGVATQVSSDDGPVTKKCKISNI